jgi:TPR repeat protein
MKASVLVALVAAGLFLPPASSRVSGEQTNALPARTTVAVLRWMAAEPPPLAPEDRHWLRTFSALVARDLGFVTALRVLPEDAVLRECARQKREEPDNTNAVVGVQRLAENLRASWVILGSLARTGATWTVHAHAVDAKSGKFGDRLTATSTNWFELRDQVVQHVLRILNITPSPEDRRNMGKVWTTSPKAFELLSQARSDLGEDPAQLVAVCRKALAEDERFAQARGVLAASLYTLGRDEEALAEAKAALNLEVDDRFAASLRAITAHVYFRQKQESLAQQEVAQGLRASPDDSDLLVLQSTLYERSGNLEAAGDCLGRALESDPRNAAIYARLGRLKSKQGDLTNALANLELAQQLAADTPPDEQLEIELALARGYESVGNVVKALEHYRNLLARASDQAVPEAKVKWVEDVVVELERRSQPVPVAAEPPRPYSPAELQAALRDALTTDEFALAVNPIAGTPEMDRWAQETVAGTDGELARARKLFERLAKRPKAAAAGSRTAREVFDAWNDLGQPFCCQEYAKLFVALARSLGLRAFYVHVERDYSDRVVDHDCAVVFAEGKAWLVDPAYAWFGVPHREFRVMDDLQTVAHHAFQPHGGKHNLTLCRAGCKLDPEFAWGRFNLVLSLVQEGKFEEARSELDAARKKAPEHWRGYQLEGLLALRQDRNERALEWLRKAQDANPASGDTRLLLGQAWFRNGQHAAARDSLVAGLRLSGSAANEAMARETLALLEAALTPGSNSLFTATSSLDAGSYYHLGLSFLTGSKPDYTQAAKWFRQAAEMGEPHAQLALGLLYWSGRGIEPNAQSAVGWFRKAAEAGEPSAMRMLGAAYSRGVGVERSREEALRWMRRAAEGGDAEAQAALGKAYYEGRAVPRNLGEALFWLTLAVDSDSKPSGAWLGEKEANNVLHQAPALLKEIELFGSPEQKAEAKARAEQFKARKRAD